MTITNVVSDGDELKVTWKANYTPDASRNHIHVYWDTYTADQVSNDAASRGVKQGEWVPTDAYPRVRDRKARCRWPSEATRRRSASPRVTATTTSSTPRSSTAARLLTCFDGRAAGEPAPRVAGPDRSLPRSDGARDGRLRRRRPRLRRSARRRCGDQDPRRGRTQRTPTSTPGSSARRSCCGGSTARTSSPSTTRRARRRSPVPRHGVRGQADRSAAASRPARGSTPRVW